LLAADDPAHPTVFTPLAPPTVFTPSIPLTVCVLRVRRACEGGEPNQTARSVATGASHRLHTSVAPHRLHTVDSTGRWRPARALRLPRRRAQSDCFFRCHWGAPPSSHLLRSPPSSHRRLHWPSASCACAAPLGRPTVFTPSTPPAVGVLRVRRACSLMQVS